MSLHRVLVVEDDCLMADLLTETLDNDGYSVVGPARSLTEGRKLVDEDLSAAILDFNLGHGETANPLAWSLDRIKVPVIFYTGVEDLGSEDIPEGTRCVHKASGVIELLAVLEEVCTDHFGPESD